MNKFCAATFCLNAIDVLRAFCECYRIRAIVKNNWMYARVRSRSWFTDHQFDLRLRECTNSRHGVRCVCAMCLSLFCSLKQFLPQVQFNCVRASASAGFGSRANITHNKTNCFRDEIVYVKIRATDVTSGGQSKAINTGDAKKRKHNWNRCWLCFDWKLVDCVDKWNGGLSRVFPDSSVARVHVLNVYCSLLQINMLLMVKLIWNVCKLCRQLVTFRLHCCWLYGFSGTESTIFS